MTICAALCVWVAVAFGGPSERAMWILAVVCVLGSIVSLFLRERKRKDLPDFRVIDALEPTYRLIHAEIGGRDEIWQLVLGKTHCELIRPDGSRASRFARSWAELGIRLPGFVSGEHLGVATDEWSPPEDDLHDVSTGEIFEAAKKITRWGAAEIPCYWFLAPKPLIREIDSYRKQTRLECGSDVARPIRIKARRDLVTGVIGLLAGVPILAIGVVQFIENPQQRGRNAGPPDHNRARLPALGGVIAFLALWRLGRGIALRHQAARLAGSGKGESG